MLSINGCVSLQYYWYTVFCALSCATIVCCVAGVFSTQAPAEDWCGHHDSLHCVVGVHLWKFKQSLVVRSTHHLHF